MKQVLFRFLPDIRGHCASRTPRQWIIHNTPPNKARMFGVYAILLYPANRALMWLPKGQRWLIATLTRQSIWRNWLRHN